MKTDKFRIPLLSAALSISVAISLQAAPSLPVTKPPVTPFNLTGPNFDPASTNGQWFLDLATGGVQYRTHEFHDNRWESGGGDGETYAISGTVVPNSISALWPTPN